MSSNNTSGSDIPDGINPDLWTAWMELRKECYPDLIEGVNPSYGYRPTLGAGIAFDVLFGICVIGHLIQLIRFRQWTSGLMMVGAISAYYPFPFSFICCCPSFIAGALTHIMSTGLSTPWRWIMFHWSLHIIHNMKPQVHPTVNNLPNQ